jgi:hypothetical protein
MAGWARPAVARAERGGGPAVARVAIEPAARRGRPRGDLRGAPRRGTRLVVDNTFATPLLQRPLELGADIAIHSATKLIGGHSDLLLGAALTADPRQLELLRAARGRNGATPGMLECFLALRGARTLALRLRHAQGSARQLASRLQSHPAVVRVRYPGFGTIVSFELPSPDAADRACRDRDHPSCDESGWDRDDDGTARRSPRSGTHPGRFDPAQRRL